METFSIIQGDTANISVYVKNPEEMKLVRATFVCKSLQLQKNLAPTEDDQYWELHLTASETAELRVGRWGFDVCVYDDNDERVTAIHEGCLEVKYSRNKWE